jgi:hypothetical protein
MSVSRAIPVAFGGGNNRESFLRSQPFDLSPSSVAVYIPPGAFEIPSALSWEYSVDFRTSLSWSPMAIGVAGLIDEGDPPVAVFLLHRDEDGDLVFSDTEGAMYGTGRTFRDAVSDWLVSAEELSQSLHSCGSSLHYRVSRRLDVVDAVLAANDQVSELGAT